MDKLFIDALNTTLIWSDKLMLGYLHPNGRVRTNYFNEYKVKTRTRLGKELLKFRLDIVNFHTQKRVCDIGIGDGSFIKLRKKSLPTVGYDVDPLSIDWLKRKKLFYSVYDCPNLDCSLTFFDSLEHIKDPSILLTKVLPNNHIFVSIPIFRDREHALTSKHYKPGEHIWYFSRKGFINWMEYYGCILLEETKMESLIGREDIMTFVFIKK